jgi:hypothetical protein
MTPRYPTNRNIAEALDRIADLLEAQGADRFRVEAYRRAARRINDQEKEVSVRVLSDGEDDLEALPDIGKRIAAAVREFVRTGRIGLLDRLEGEIAPQDLLRTVPTIGPTLARRLHERLDIETLEELEAAAHEGDLERVDGIGPRRANAIRDSVGALLNRSGRRRAIRRRTLSGGGEARSSGTAEPPAGLILQVDAEYRRKAAAGRLKTIAPRRFNPGRTSWLPIMQTEKKGWHVKALFSNTARAHDLDRVKDWVVVYYDRGDAEGQCTVVTETAGALKGRRVIRGRESQCRRYYRSQGRQSEAS